MSLSFVVPHAQHFATTVHGGGGGGFAERPQSTELQSFLGKREVENVADGTSSTSRSWLGACMCLLSGIVAVSWRRPLGRADPKRRRCALEASSGVQIGSKQVPIWVVNLDRDTVRWQQTVAELGTQGLVPERFSAVLGKALSDEEIQAKTTFGARYFCTPGMIGCFLSHRSAWEKVVAEGHDQAIIFEDDVVIRPDFKAKLDTVLKELPADWEVCTIGALGVVSVEKENMQMKLYGMVAGGTIPCPGDTRSISENLFVPYKPLGTHAYMISKRGAKTLLERLPLARYHVDLAAWRLPGLKLYAPKSFLATQRFDGISTVSKAGDPLTRRFLSWTLKITGIDAACRAGGVEDPAWVWKVAIWALPVPFSRRRLVVEMGPVTAVWIGILIVALARRSLVLAGVGIAYQGVTAILTQWLSGSLTTRIVLMFALSSAATIYAGL